MTLTPELTLAAGERDTLGEGPIWDAKESWLYWTDSEEGRYHRLQPHTGKRETFAVGVKVGAIALREGGGLLLATQAGFAFHRPQAGAALEVVHNPEPSQETRFNDGAASPEGRYWAGSYGADANSLYRLGPDLEVHQMGSGYGVPNGIGWSLDGKLMYFTDSDAKTVYAFDYDTATGDIDNRRPFIHKPDARGVPDGLIVDAEGCIWNGWFGGWRLERHDPDGKLERVYEMPMESPTSLAFGGAGLDTLYVTSASRDLDEGALAEQPLAGKLVCFSPGVRGREEPRFKG
ncbi:N/A [soil metagenome]